MKCLPVEKTVRRLANLQRLLALHKSPDGSVHVFQDLILVTYRGQKLELVEFTSENYLLQAFFYKDLLVTIDKKNSLECYKIDSLLKVHNPTEEELEVQRVRLVQPHCKYDLMSSTVNDYGGIIKKANWVEITSDYKSQQEEVYSRLKSL